jgi:uncharacterized protein YbaP (TraB family)
MGRTLIRTLSHRASPAVVTVLLGLIVAHSGANAAAQPGASGTLEEVLVTGERPGPGMWRVSKGGHDLWILATLEPLPKRMTWRSAAVEAQIAASQIVIAPPQVTTNVGFFHGLTLLPSLLRARKSPDGLTLEQSLPHDVYMRWLGLRVKYLGNGGNDEQMRPMVAALDLYLHALDESGLTTDDSVWDIVEKTAGRQHVPILPVTLKLAIEDPKASIRQFSAISRDAEVACLEKTMERLETDLQPMRERANMWSLGDVQGLRAQHYPDERTVCLNALVSVPQLRDQFEQAKLQIDDAWIAAAEGALAKNASSFAVLPITEMLKPGGWLDKLREQGFEVKEP